MLNPKTLASGKYPSFREWFARNTRKDEEVRAEVAVKARKARQLRRGPLNHPPIVYRRSPRPPRHPPHHVPVLATSSTACEPPFIELHASYCLLGPALRQEMREQEAAEAEGGAGEAGAYTRPLSSST